MKENYDAKKLIAGNYANFHRHGWSEVEAILKEKRWFKNHQDIYKDLKNALKHHSLPMLEELMQKYGIVSVYPLPKESLLKIN